ncbi:MAG: cytochrome c3 family protein [Calditrichia bacterium]|nr:cytochrome c3 family protein [Calditrichia bacterium]
MAQIFPKWTNKAPLVVVIFIMAVFIAVIGFIWYYGSPEYTDVGYKPKQPIDYSHKMHVGEIGMDCRYCHTGVETSPAASIPPTQTCMNCHTLVKSDSKKLKLLRQSWAEGKPLEWIRIHNLPDYSYFDHSAHLTAGVGCESCHGNIAEMEVVEQKKPLSMSWCLDCHRNPEKHIRPMDQLTVMNWKQTYEQLVLARATIKDKKITPPLNCSGCHR